MTEVVSPGPNLLSPETEAAASSPVRTSDPETERSSPPVRTSDPVTGGVISPVRTSSPETEAAASSPVRTSDREVTERSSPPVRTSSPSAPTLPSFSPSLLRESSTPQDRPASPLSSSSASLSTPLEEPPLTIKQPRVMLSKLLVNDHCSLSISSSPGVSQSSGPLLSTPSAPPPFSTPSAPPLPRSSLTDFYPRSLSLLPQPPAPPNQKKRICPSSPCTVRTVTTPPPPPTTTPRRPSQPPHLQLLAPAETGPPLHHQDLQGGGSRGATTLSAFPGLLPALLRKDVHHGVLGLW